MTQQPISLEELELTREKIVKLINQRLSNKQREFLIGFKKGKPNWPLLELEGISNLPAVNWKMLNLERMESKARKEAIKKLTHILYPQEHAK